MKRAKPIPQPVLEPVITIQLLRDLDACAPQVRKFRRIFGDSVVPTKELLLKHRERFSIYWLLAELSPLAYDDCRDALNKEGERIHNMPSYKDAEQRRKHKINLLMDLPRPKGLSNIRWGTWYKEVNDSIWKEFKGAVYAHDKECHDIEAALLLKYLSDALVARGVNRRKS